MASLLRIRAIAAAALAAAVTLVAPAAARAEGMPTGTPRWNAGMPERTGAEGALINPEVAPPELAGIDIVEKPGAALPLDLPLRTHDDRAVKLGDYFGDGKPAILVMAYYACPMLCSLVLNGLLAGLKDVAWTAGEEFRIVVVSFDRNDTASVAAAKRASYLEAYGRPAGPRAFDFLLADDASAKRLGDAIGFTYRWDEQQKQYAHGAGIFVTTSDGRLSRTLYGIQFPKQQLELALLEAGRGEVGNAFEKILLFCFHYDPAARSYVVAIRRLMQAGAALTLLVIGFFLARSWRAERARSLAARIAAAPLSASSPLRSR